MNEPRIQPLKAPGKRIAFVLAVLIHVVLILLIVYGIRWQTKTEDVVEVDLVRAVPEPPTAAAQPAPQPKPEPKPQPEPKPEPKPVAKPEPVKPPPKPDIAQKSKPLPKPEPKPEPRGEPPKDPFKEQLEREMKEAEQRRASLAAAEELARIKAQQANAIQATAMADYIAKIRGKVRGNIVLPADVKGNPEAVFEVTQLPSGEVLEVRLKKSSGNPAWDAATERAIRKSSPLPTPAQKELFSRTLELRFRPQEE
ncbi:energy transducer TonB [Sulfuricystis multivorans]|uniref:energy transducer TonB n=1 Tax=Sulfuricystis multivorans TaxID=2211108 RepID=UPI000F83F721|nr:energy transducer TonB [Sulfuricystis multivorans]